MRSVLIERVQKRRASPRHERSDARVAGRGAYDHRPLEMPWLATVRTQQWTFCTARPLYRRFARSRSPPSTLRRQANYEKPSPVEATRRYHPDPACSRKCHALQATVHSATLIQKIGGSVKLDPKGPACRLRLQRAQLHGAPSPSTFSLLRGSTLGERRDRQPMNARGARVQHGPPPSRASSPARRRYSRIPSHTDHGAC